jgi:DNA-binding response OmpR family regulator
MKVLVIDDEKEILLMVEKALGRNGYEVVTVSNIPEAAKLIRNNKWDLIITDVMIPYAGGFELVEDVKSMSDTPVIMMTGMSEDVLSATINKADKILHKPFSSEELIHAAREFTGESV